MELFSLSLQGYRRFKQKTVLRTNGKLVALIGPNESGKSSIIEALRELTSDAAMESSQIARGVAATDVSTIGKFLLSQEELQLARLSGPHWLVVDRRADGQIFYSVEPRAPTREIDHRDRVAGLILSVVSNAAFRAILESEDDDLPEEMEAAFQKLMEAPENVSAKLLEELSRLRDSFADALGGQASKAVREALAGWTDLMSREAQPSPTRYAIDQLVDRIPSFLLFDDEERDLASSYAVSQIRIEIPPALRNLAEVGGLEMSELFATIDSGDRPALTTLEHRVNRRLAERFTESWRQSGVTAAFRLSPELLEVQVVNELSEFTALAERSDGLRQFIALHAFALRKQLLSPVLLIDEAEQRLHYNAQADLVQMLAKQQVSPKIIYTTHSAGCLPEDLGNGVRLVKVQEGDLSSSQVVNKFWAEPGGGFQPLLIGMGASTLAFFPTRRAVLVEGPADMLLYPALFREISEKEYLGFQFVPGLSTTGQVLAPLIPGNDHHIVYLADGDEGGLEIAEKLQRAGVDKTRIVHVRNPAGTALEIEDYIDSRVLLRAANRLLALFHPLAVPIQVSELANGRRMAALKAAYSARSGVPVPKVELAYELLRLKDEQPTLMLHDSRRRKALANILARLIELFVQG